MPKERLIKYIHYCDLIYRAIISEPALLLATMESLEMRGALPVGELGKAMCTHSQIVVISKHIKDKYNGLKKFLERYPSIFIMSNDHAHNPHVYLRSRLSAQHKELILRGAEDLLPIEVMVKYRMVRGKT